MAEMELTPVGRVESTLTDRAAAPMLECLEGPHPGDRILVLTWLDRADRSVLRVHPRDDLTRPEQGVFTTRSSDRPNPIGHEVEVLEIDGRRVHVRPLEALDGTPILDVKPVLRR